MTRVELDGGLPMADDLVTLNDGRIVRRMLTKSKFLSLYREALVEAYLWAKNIKKLDSLVAKASRAIHTKGVTGWYSGSNVARSVYAKNGGQGHYSLRKLRSLPED